MNALIRCVVAAVVVFCTLAEPCHGQEARLSNLAVRARSGGSDTIVTGFTIGPGPNKTVLLRAIGPTLADFNVPGTLPDPKLELFNSASVKIAENDNFSPTDESVFASLGAFALKSGSKDAALVITLAPGGYTAQVTGVGGTSGLALLEIYEFAGGSTRLVNLSARAWVGAGADILVPGISIAPGSGTRRLLIRAIGPTLAAFNVPGAVSDPRMELLNSDRVKIAENDNWSAPIGAGMADGTTLSMTFAQNGAFALEQGTKDAALLVNLSAGGYTLQVSGVGNSTGNALVEVYDVTPALPPPSISAQPQSLSLNPGATASFSVAVSAGDGATYQWSKDGVPMPGATFSTLILGGIQPSSAGAYSVAITNASGTVTSAVATLTVVLNLPVISAQPQSLTLTAGVDGLFSVATSTSGPLTYQWQKNGSAIAGATSPLLALAGVQVTSAGAYSVVITNSSGSVTSAVATLTVNPNQTGIQPSASLYVAQLRPDPTAVGSTASGYATILIGAGGNASVNVTFTNLSSAETSAHLRFGATGDFLLNLPSGQFTGAIWTFTPRGALTTNDLVNALNEGNIFISLDSARFPAGELRGNFLTATGSQTFVAPANPPALPSGALSNPTQSDAARFLTQATFGPTTTTINALRSRGINGWINDQMALPVTSALGALRADLAAFPNPPILPELGDERFAWEANWNAAWWKIAMTASDQLRHRVAFALSEILVVGRQDDITFNLEAKVWYYDLLVNQAFGNFRLLIEDVSLNAAMGSWLSHKANLKANPVKGTAPDENYAREIHQLFTIGLVQLQPDGTLLLDATGQTIPTYNQAIITETAEIFTGWTFAGLSDTETNEGAFVGVRPEQTRRAIPFSANNSWFLPMKSYEAFHDKTAKTVVSLQQKPLAEAAPTVIPAGQTGPQDLKIFLDTLFNHPNTGPFICKQLIQRLVTSNPSASYVYRVACVFANDGAGTRGNLGAVVRAIVTDYEARSPDVLGNVGFGKVKEPLLRMSGFLRALKAAAPNGRYMDSYFQENRSGPQYAPNGIFATSRNNFAQEPLASPTVFNFFSPSYSPPGPMARSGLVAPELEITDSNYAIQVPNQMTNLMYRNAGAFTPPPTGASPFIVLDYSDYLVNARNPSALVEQLDLLLCAGQMSSAARNQIIATLQTLTGAATDVERVQTAVQLTLVSPDCAIQK